MNFDFVNNVVEDLRAETQLYLPALSPRRGFSSTRTEHLLNRLVAVMPENEVYFEVGTLEGRTLESAALGNPTKHLVGCDPCDKYGIVPADFPSNVTFIQATWEDALDLIKDPIGLAFYDGDHSSESTFAFMETVVTHMADNAVLVLDDWDRKSVRQGAFAADIYGWRLLREMPEWTDGLTTAGHQFGYFFGCSVWGFKRK